MKPSSYFAENHQDLDGWIHYEIQLDPYSQSLIGLLDPKKDHLVLDDGCGNGRFSIAMIREGARIVALDINKSILNAAANWTRQKKLNSRLDLIRGDIQKLPFQENVFDRLLCAHNLWYIPNYQAAVSEMFRTLKPGGKAVVDHLNILNWRVLLAYCLYLIRKTLKQNPTPVFFRSPKEILEPFTVFITKVYSLSLSRYKQTVNLGGKALTPRIIIDGAKRSSLQGALEFNKR